MSYQSRVTCYDDQGAAFSGGEWRTHDGMTLDEIVSHLKGRGRRFHLTAAGYTLVDKRTIKGEVFTYVTDFREAQHDAPS